MSNDLLRLQVGLRSADPIVGFRPSTQPTKTVCRGYFDTKIKTQRSHLDRISSILTFVDRVVFILAFTINGLYTNELVRNEILE